MSSAVPSLLRKAKTGAWKVKPGRPTTNITEGVFQSPLADKTRERIYRLHEYGHLAWDFDCLSDYCTKDSRPNPMFINAVLDARVDSLLLKQGLLSNEEASWYNTRNCADYSQVKSLIDEVIPDRQMKKTYEVISVLSAGLPSNLLNDDCGEEVAADIESMRKEIFEKSTGDPEKDKEMVLSLATRLQATYLFNKEKELEQVSKRMESEVKALNPDDGDIPVMTPELDATAMALSGKAQVIEPSLEERMQVTYNTRPSDEGAVPRFMHNWCNGNIFGERKKFHNETTTILVDMSGSMNLQKEQVVELLSKIKSCKVAHYHGNSASKEGEGEIVVVGHNAKYTKDIRRKWAGNVIDYPSLKWLAGHKGRKVWISDALVTGMYDGSHDQILPACRALQEQAGIERYRTIDEFMKEGLKKR